jgi:hypothetical protein
MLTITADPKHLGVRIGITSVLHTLALGNDPSPPRAFDRTGRRHLKPCRVSRRLGFFPPGARALAPVPQDPAGDQSFTAHLAPLHKIELVV